LVTLIKFFIKFYFKSHLFCQIVEEEALDKKKKKIGVRGKWNIRTGS